jgi:hypothetical protein
MWFDMEDKKSMPIYSVAKSRSATYDVQLEKHISRRPGGLEHLWGNFGFGAKPN